VRTRKSELRVSKIGRDDWIRTSDPLTPSQVRYQAAPHPDLARKIILAHGIRPWLSGRDYAFARERFPFAALRLPEALATTRGFGREASARLAGTAARLSD
jgi:hypothetical protein